MYGFCSLPVVPMRAEASDRAEMVSQLLFGDTFMVEQQGEKWTLIVMDYDGYRGWVDTKQIYFLDEDDYNKVKGWTIVSELLHVVAHVGGTELLLPMGCKLPKAGESAPSGLAIEHYVAHDGAEASPLDIATKWLGVPYLWGGKTCMGVDCSGFTQTVYKVCSIKLLRDASQQATQGHAVHSLDAAQEGDLCFFHNADGRIIHVGIYMGNGRIIHASGCVRIDTLDTKGIYNADVDKYTHTLSAIRRIR